jgi:succinate-acetate transporter protein
MGDRIADPKALGFAAFGTMAWMYSMMGAGWVTASTAVALVLHQAATFSMLALLIAALAAFLRGEAWHAFFFMFWSALILGYRGVVGATAAMGPPGAADGWYSLIVAVVSFFLFLAAMRSAVGIAVVILALAATLAFLSQALGYWLGGGFWVVLGGYIGLVSGLASFWAMIAAAGRIGAGSGQAATS